MLIEIVKNFQKKPKELIGKNRLYFNESLEVIAERGEDCPARTERGISRRLRPLLHDCNLFRSDLQAFSRQHVAKKSHFWLQEITFGPLAIELACLCSRTHAAAAHHADAPNVQLVS